MEQSLVHFGREIKGLSGTGNNDPETWPTPEEGALQGDVRTRYLSRKLGVKLYLAGQTEAYIREKCGIGLKQVYRLITERCLRPHPDGQIYGWRGLVPHVHLQPYTRRRKVTVDSFGNGASGAMGALLDMHPSLRLSFEKRILAAPAESELGPTRRARQVHWKWFLDELRKLGYELRGEWPFNTASNGYSTVCRYIDAVYKMNPKKAARAIGGPDLEKKLRSGDGVDRPVDRVFQRVEMDAHKLDGRFCVMIPDAQGGHVPRMIYRIWVLVILEIVSRAVLGYFMSMGREVSKEDVLRAIKAALSRWYPRMIAPGITKYQDGAGLPSGISDRYLAACWDETSVDGALAETCVHVERVLKDVVGSRLVSPNDSFSSRRSMDDRPFIETWFRNISSAGFQRLSNTTGANPKKRNGRNPDHVALTSQFQLEYAEDLLDVLIANYNATPHTSLGYRSPLAYLDFICTRPGEALRYADANQIQDLLSYRKKCRVVGGIEQGRVPYVNFVGARLTNEILGQRFDLVGQYIWVVNHIEDDARVAQASTLHGQSLGILRASPPWSKLPHSLRIRRAVSSGLRRKMFYVASGEDAIENFIEFSEAQVGRKLPLHPAYLELRRVLEQRNVDRGQATLAGAIEKASIDGDEEQTASNATQVIPADISPQQDQSNHPLPRRRTAASD